MPTIAQCAQVISKATEQDAYIAPSHFSKSGLTVSKDEPSDKAHGTVVKKLIKAFQHEASKLHFNLSDQQIHAEALDTFGSAKKITTDDLAKFTSKLNQLSRESIQYTSSSPDEVLLSKENSSASLHSSTSTHSDISDAASTTKEQSLPLPTTQKEKTQALMALFDSVYNGGACPKEAKDEIYINTLNRDLIDLVSDKEFRKTDAFNAFKNHPLFKNNGEILERRSEEYRAENAQVQPAQDSSVESTIRVLDLMRLEIATANAPDLLEETQKTLQDIASEQPEPSTLSAEDQATVKKFTTLLDHIANKELPEEYDILTMIGYAEDYAALSKNPEYAGSPENKQLAEYYDSIPKLDSMIKDAEAAGKSSFPLIKARDIITNAIFDYRGAELKRGEAVTFEVPPSLE
ncbi:MAG: hypothetical protein MI749_04710 [Desulfovibrionales bacterium]|nr:hypothetical protein [Desulfovibrionales bacterium]